MEWSIVLVTLLAISNAEITTESTTIFQSHPEILPDFSLTTNSGASVFEENSSVTPASTIEETDDAFVSTTATNLETIALEPEESIKVEVSEIPAVTSRVSEVTEQSYESTTEDAFVSVKETTVSDINKEVFSTFNYLDSSTKVTTLKEVTNVSPSQPTPASTLIPQTPKSTSASVIAQTSQKFSVQPVTTSALPLQTQTPQSHPTSALVQPTNITIVNKVPSKDSNATITNQENIMNSDGSYKYGFNTSNGISVQAEGVSRNYNSTYNASDENNSKPTRNIVVSGGFSWSDPNGKKISMKYTADETGYHPEGDAIPTPPPIPPQIAKALAWIRKVLAEKKEKELKEAHQDS